MSDFVGPVLGVVMLLVFCYVGGRVHQFYRQGLEREEAYRDGYNTATKSLFSIAARTSKVMEPPPLLDLPKDRRVPMRGSAPVPQPARHRTDGGKSTLQEAGQQPTAWEKYKSA